MKWLCLVILVGCVSRPLILPSGLKFDEFLADQKLRGDRFKTITSKVDFSFEGSEKIAGSGKLYMDLQSLQKKFFLEIKDFLGRVHFQLVGDGKQCVAIYPQEKKAIRDSSGGTHYLARLGFQVPFSDLQTLLVGIVPTSWKLDGPSWLWDEIGYRIRAKTELGKYGIQIWVDGQGRGIQRVVQEGKFDLTVKDFGRTENSLIDFGHELKLEVEGRNLQLNWDDTPQPTSLDSKIFSLLIPAGFSTVDI